MKKILLTLIVLMFGLQVSASDREDALQFFNDFVKASNSYNTSLPSMYSDNAKIIRQVIKPDGTLVNVPFKMADYRSQMKLSAKVAKIRNYKNYYSNIVVSKDGSGYRINAVRKPSLSDDKFKTSTVVTKQPSGKWLITEEMMQTREQIFLKYAK